jgi:adenylosuccinate synthase
MATVFVGLTFGDEGKGRIIDYVSEFSDVVVRYAGGPNAGHTLDVDGQKTILRLVPSGILQDHTKCYLAQGMVLDPFVLADEIKALQKLGIDLHDRLYVSAKAHMIMPEHLTADYDGNGIGTTKKGVGPAYASKVNRKSVRLHDYINTENMSDQELEVVNTIRPFVQYNCAYILNTHIQNGDAVIFEGAQGTLLDIDHGTYPYVTSSNSTAGGACTGTGVSPTHITSVLGITKAYTTRVGDGPFPTEINGDLADTLRNAGQEFGSVTKRPRRIGWLDMPLLKYATMINGCEQIAITKLDILSGLDEIKVCTGYKYSEIDTDIIPFNLNDAKPIYTTLPGWKEDISGVRSLSGLPDAARQYVNFIEKSLDVTAILVSVGSEREAIIDRIDEMAQRSKPQEVVIPIEMFNDKEALINAIRRFGSDGSNILS